MSRRTYHAVPWLLGVALLTGAALAACSSSDSSSKTATPSRATNTSAATSPTTASTGAATTVSGAITSVASRASETSTGSAGSTSGSGTLPDDACKLMSESDASKLGGAAVTGHSSGPVPGLHPGGTTMACKYYGPNGTGDHDVTLYVTSFKDADAAKQYVETVRKQYEKLPGYNNVSGVGDEAYDLTLESMANITARSGALVLEISAGSTDFPAPPMADLEAAARTVVSKL